MSAKQFHNLSRAGVPSNKSITLHTQNARTGKVLKELFNLLEEYAPVWYTERQHNRAAVALRILDEG